MSQFPNNVTKATLSVSFKQSAVAIIAPEENTSLLPNILHMKIASTPKPVLQVKVRTLAIPSALTPVSNINDTGYTWVG